jgi:hypothetical protein
MGAMHASNTPRNTLLMQRVAKLVVAAVVVVVTPQRIWFILVGLPQFQ